MLPFDYPELFDAERLGIPELETTSTRFLLRLLVAAHDLDPREMGDEGLYTRFVPCEMCCRRPSSVREVEASLAAIARACTRLIGPALAENRLGDSNLISSVKRDVAAIVPYFGERGFCEAAYERDREMLGIRATVTTLRRRLDMSSRAMLEERLAHRPELLQAGLLDSISLWWDKWKWERSSRGQEGV